MPRGFDNPETASRAGKLAKKPKGMAYMKIHNPKRFYEITSKGGSTPRRRKDEAKESK